MNGSLEEFRIEYQTPDGTWWVWREYGEKERAIDDLRSVKTNETAKAWRLVKVTFVSEVLDA